MVAKNPPGATLSCVAVSKHFTPGGKSMEKSNWLKLFERWSIVFFLSVLTVITLYLAGTVRSDASFHLFGVSLLLLVVVYAYEVLGARIGGQHIQLENRIEQVQKEQESLRKVATTLIMISRVQKSGASRLGGVPIEYYKIIDKYSESISPFLAPEWAEKVESDVAIVEEKMKKSYEAHLKEKTSLPD